MRHNVAPRRRAAPAGQIPAPARQSLRDRRNAADRKENREHQRRLTRADDGLGEITVRRMAATGRRSAWLGPDEVMP